MFTREYYLKIRRELNYDLKLELSRKNEIGVKSCKTALTTLDSLAKYFGIDTKL